MLTIKPAFVSYVVADKRTKRWLLVATHYPYSHYLISIFLTWFWILKTNSFNSFKSYFFYVIADKRTERWLLVATPIPILLIWIAYLVLVWIGPKMMKRRTALNLKQILIPYNLAMQVLSAYMCYEVWWMCFLFLWTRDFEYAPIQSNHRLIIDNGVKKSKMESI